jgi:quercetin dioxygenase-like cupin family protein
MCRMQVSVTQCRPFSWGFASYVYMSREVTVKNLHFKKGGYTSYHFHARRMEILHVATGKFVMYTLDQKGETMLDITVLPGNTVSFYPGQAHQIVALEDGIIVETSEEYSEHDTKRLIKGMTVDQLSIDSLQSK